MTEVAASGSACPTNLERSNPANPSRREGGGIGRHRQREREAIHQLARVSTRLGHPAARNDSDRVARECSAAVQGEMDCRPGEKAFRDRCATVSRRNGASMGIPRANPWRRTKFANRCAVDTGQGTEAADPDYPVWL